MTQKKNYQNTRTREVREFEIELDENERIPMYQYINGEEWKAVSEWALNLVNSGEFFRSAHENTVKFHSPPLDGSDMPYGIT